MMVEVCKTLDYDIEKLYLEIKTQMEFQDQNPQQFICSNKKGFNTMLTKKLEEAAESWSKLKKEYLHNITQISN